MSSVGTIVACTIFSGNESRRGPFDHYIAYAVIVDFGFDRVGITFFVQVHFQAICMKASLAGIEAVMLYRI